jgi:hypothetical protein
MRRKLILSAAAAAALIGSSVSAQGRRTSVGSVVRGVGTASGGGIAGSRAGTQGSLGVFAQGNTVTLRTVVPAGVGNLNGLGTGLNNGVGVSTGAAVNPNQGPLQFTPGVGFVPGANSNTFGFGGVGGGVTGPLQFTPGTGFVPAAGNTPGFGGTGGGIAGPLQFVPGTGFVPGNNTLGGAAGATTGSGFNNGFGNGFTNGFGSGFVPGVGTGFGTGFNNGFGTGFNNGGGVDQFGNPINTGSGFSQAGSPMIQTGFPGYGYGYGGGYYPSASSGGYYGNGYPSGNGASNNVVYVPVPVQSDDNSGMTQGTGRGTGSGARRSGSGMSDMEVRRAAARPQQKKLASEMRNIMEEHPMTEGEITQLSTGHVTVRYTVDGQTRTERFSNDEVFFFRQNPSTGETEMATVAIGSSRVRVGDKVMVPLNNVTVNTEPRQAVAGSRQEMRSTRRRRTAR